MPATDSSAVLQIDHRRPRDDNWYVPWVKMEGYEDPNHRWKVGVEPPETIVLCFTYIYPVWYSFAKMLNEYRWMWESPLMIPIILERAKLFALESRLSWSKPSWPRGGFSYTPCQRVVQKALTIPDAVHISPVPNLIDGWQLASAVPLQATRPRNIDPAQGTVVSIKTKFLTLAKPGKENLTTRKTK